MVEGVQQGPVPVGTFFTGMHCVRVGCCVTTLGLSPLCSFRVRVFTSFALHRSKLGRKEICP